MICILSLVYRKKKVPEHPTWKVVYSETMVKNHDFISDYTLVLKEDFGVFVESSENSHSCPVCRETLHYRDSRPRIRKKEGGTKEQLMIRRFRCQNCHAYHNELPDCLSIEHIGAWPREKTLFKCYDGKSGELWPDAKPEVSVGTVFHIEITDELREEYKVEKAAVSKKVEELNALLAKEGAELMESSEYAKFYYMGKKDGDYYAIVGYKVFHLYDSYFFLTMKTDPSKDSIEVTDAWYKGQSIDKPTLDIDQYKRVY